MDFQWTQADLARKLDMSRETINRIINNERVESFSMLKQIAELLNLSPDYLIKGAGIKISDIFKNENDNKSSFHTDSKGIIVHDYYQYLKHEKYERQCISFYDWIHSLSYFYSTEFLNDSAFPQALVLDEK